MTEDISLTRYSRVFGFKPRKKIMDRKRAQFFIFILSINGFINGDLL